MARAVRRRKATPSVSGSPCRAPPRRDWSLRASPAPPLRWPRAPGRSEAGSAVVVEAQRRLVLDDEHARRVTVQSSGVLCGGRGPGTLTRDGGSVHPETAPKAARQAGPQRYEPSSRNKSSSLVRASKKAELFVGVAEHDGESPLGRPALHQHEGAETGGVDRPRLRSGRSPASRRLPAASRTASSPARRNSERVSSPRVLPGAQFAHRRVCGFHRILLDTR